MEIMKRFLIILLSLLFVSSLCSCSDNKSDNKSVKDDNLKIINVLIHDYETGRDIYNYPDKELIKELQDIYDNARYIKIKNGASGFGLDINVLFKGRKDYYRMGYLAEKDEKYFFKTDEESDYGYPIKSNCALVSVCENYGIKVDYGKSKLYSKEDIQINCVDKIRKKFYSFRKKLDSFKKGAGTLYELTYKGDDYSKSQLSYCNNLKEKNEPDFKECMVFDSFFHTDKDAEGAWEPDSDYTWSWYLAKNSKGKWIILTYGY